MVGSSSLMTRFARIFALAVALAATFSFVPHSERSALAADSATPVVGSFLPEKFNGWHRSDLISITDASRAASAAEPKNDGLLKEFGLTGFDSATYTRDDAKIMVRGLRFTDATGAYGAFTFYKSADMFNEQIGDQGYSLGNRILFYRANIVMDVSIEKMTPMSGADMRGLADALTPAIGAATNLPAVPRYLPKQGYQKNTAKFVIGPLGLAAVNAPLSPTQVDFSVEPEIALGQFQTDSGSYCTLTLIEYPTPQIAADRLRKMEASKPIAPAGQTPPAFFTKRTGPIVAIITGNASKSEAEDILGEVNFEASLTMHDNTFLDLKSGGVLGMLAGIIKLSGIVMILGLIPAVAFGVIRAYFKRKRAEETGDEGVISLKLK